MAARVFLALPHYSQLAPQALPGLFGASADAAVALHTEGGSLLALVFNRLWCRALNTRRDRHWTHFAMHHADVEAPPGWLDVLLQEQARVGADVLSVVLPIKDGRGLTSTGLRHRDSGRIRRLTVREVLGLPVTFGAAETGTAAEDLVVNTGLWLCDFSRPWVQEACFSILDGIRQDQDGSFTAHALPEDWHFSAWCAARGLKVMATRAVAVKHHGPAAYPNDTAWGEWDTDKGDG